MILKEKVRNLPLTPGVYLMKDASGNVIYVGKAKNLKRRVQSYFQKSKAHPQKIKKMVTNIQDFEVIHTDTEFEAFMLECKLIKEIKPLFNKKMKSSHSYAYAVFHMDEELHRIEITSNPKQKDGRVILGPFISRHTVEKAIISIKESYQILCSNSLKKGTACLNYSLGLCIGICLGGPAIDQHNKIISKIIALLEGADMCILEELEKKMRSAAESFEYETAMKYRDKIDTISLLINKEKVIEFTEANKNIMIIEYLPDDILKLFLIKRNKILFSEKYYVENIDIDHLCKIINETFNNVVLTFSNEVSRDELDESQIIYSYLNCSTCNFLEIPDLWFDHDNKNSLEIAIRQLLNMKSPQVSP